MRNIYNTLKLWKNSEKRKPLLIRGVRQVGKTYLMQDFAKQEYKAFLYLNFEKDKTLDSLFKDNLDPRKIIENLEIFFNTKLNIHEDLLIFDEVQESPSALNSLKYFSESEKSYHVLAAGSLLGVKLNQQGFPVGKVNFVDLYPLTFLEFLAAINETKLFDYLNNLTNQQTPAEAIHLKLLDIFKTYLLIGGMPEVVYNYAANKNWQAAREIQENILEAYQLDFAKHAPKDQVIRIREIFDIIPSQLAKENRKFFFNAISNSARAREYSLALTWLKDAHLIMQSHNIEIVDLPLKAHAAHNIFKVYFFDVGLLGALLKTPITLLLNPEKLFESFHGALIENFVAQ